jgi:hypothetical protein
MQDEGRFEKMVTDATSYLVKKQTDSVFNVKKKKSKVF